MSPFLVYFIKVNTALILFYIFYRLLFYKDTFWMTRRVYLLFALLLSFLYPFLSFAHWLETKEPVQLFIADYILTQEIEISPISEVSKSFSLEELSWIVYGFVAFFFLLRTVLQLVSIVRWRMKGEKINIFDSNIIKIREQKAPFSFFRWIFMNPDLHTQEEQKQILAHEETHVKQKHSIDVLLCELLTVFGWLNPATWLLKREIRQNLEFLADDKVLATGFDPKTYQYHLLQLSYQCPDLRIANKFNISPLKKRISMMNQEKTSKISLLKYALIVPMALALVVSSNAENLISSAKEKLSQQKEPPKMELSEVGVVSVDKSEQNNRLEELTVVGYERVSAVQQNEEPVFQVVEEMPKYPGGDKALFKFLQENIKYPVEAQEKSIQGRVICQFVIGKDGSISNIELRRSIHPSLDAEAVRVIKAMPKWEPGKQKGEAVAVKYTIPINFSLNSSKTASANAQSEATKTQADENGTFQVVDEMPKYPGGDKALFKFLQEAIKYPLEAQEKSIQGRVICQFVIGKDGSISNIELLRSIHPLLDAEAVRVIKAMPKWEPGKQRGEAVAVKYTIPINFSLNSSKTTSEANENSLIGRNALIIVDGELLENPEDIMKIDSKTIEQIQILDEEKAKEVLAKYGKTSADGVFVITLKK